MPRLGGIAGRNLALLKQAEHGLLFDTAFGCVQVLPL